VDDRSLAGVAGCSAWLYAVTVVDCMGWPVGLNGRMTLV